MFELSLSRPWFLFLLIPLVAYTVFLIRYKKREQSFIRSSFLELISKKQVNKPKKTQIAINILVYLSIIIALTGPTVFRDEAQVVEPTKNLIILMPLTLSMTATDLSPNRIHVAQYISDNLISMPFTKLSCLIGYSEQTDIIYPCTKDKNIAHQFIQYLTPNIFKNEQFDLLNALKKAAEISIDSPKDNYRIVLFIDQSNKERLDKASEYFNKLHLPLTIIQVGSEDGSVIPLNNGKLLKDSKGSLVITKVDTAIIQGFSNKLNAVYLDAHTAMEYPSKIFGSEQKTIKKTHQDLGIYFLLPCIALAYLFRRNFIFLLIILSQYPENSFADAIPDPYQLYKTSRYEEAAKLFSQEPIWQGNSYFKLGRYDQAIESYKKDDTYIAHFNMGNSYAFKNNYNKAIEQYNLALQINPSGKEALFNKRILEAWLDKNSQNRETVFDYLKKNQDKSSAKPIAYIDNLKANNVNILEKRLENKYGH